MKERRVLEYSCVLCALAMQMLKCMVEEEAVEAEIPLPWRLSEPTPL